MNNQKLTQPTMINLANHIIAVANYDDINISNLQLQVAMYYAFQYAIKKAKQHELFNLNQLKRMEHQMPFSNGTYCPIIKNVYKKYKIYGASPIKDFTKPSLYFNKIPFNAYVWKLLEQEPFKLIQQLKVNNKEN